MNRNAGDVLEDAHLERCGLAAEGRRNFRRACAGDLQINPAVFRCADKRRAVGVTGIPFNVGYASEDSVCRRGNRNRLADGGLDVGVSVVAALRKSSAAGFQREVCRAAGQNAIFLGDGLMARIAVELNVERRDHAAFCCFDGKICTVGVLVPPIIKHFHIGIIKPRLHIVRVCGRRIHRVVNSLLLANRKAQRRKRRAGRGFQCNAGRHRVDLEVDGLRNEINVRRFTFACAADSHLHQTEIGVRASVGCSCRLEGSGCLVEGDILLRAQRGFSAVENFCKLKLRRVLRVCAAIRMRYILAAVVPHIHNDGVLLSPKRRRPGFTSFVRVNGGDHCEHHRHHEERA